MTRTACILATFVFALFLPRSARAVVPTNDNMDNATIVSSLPFGMSQNTVDATSEAADQSCAGTGPTVWYRFRPRAAMRLEVNTFNSDYDTTLSIYSGEPGALTELACVDDSGSTLQSRVRIDVAAGETYWIMVGSYGAGNGGNLIVSMLVAPPFVPLHLALSLNASGTVRSSSGAAVVRGTVTCNVPAVVEIFGELRQKPNQRNSVGYFGVAVDCRGTTSWSAPVEAQLGRFRGRSLSLFTGGRAVISAGANGFTDEAFDSVQTSRTIRLSGGQ